MKALFTTLWLTLGLFAGWTHAQTATLKYRVTGVDDELRANVRAYLGASPDNPQDAERFLLTAESRTSQALQAFGFYRHDISVNVDRDQSPWRVVIAIEAGPAVHYTEVDVVISGEGAAVPALQKLLDTRQPKVGDVLHHGRYAEFKAELNQFARENGFFDASFSTSEVRVDSQSSTAEAKVHFDTGQRYAFGDIVLATGDFDSQIVSSLAPFSVGEPYRQAQLLEMRRRLLRLGYFSGVVVLPDVSARAAGRVPVIVELSLAPRHSYELGAGYSTDTRQRLSFLWRTPRLNRFGHSQETSLRWSPVNPAAKATYSIPLDAAATDVLQFTGRLEDNEFGDLESRQRELRVRREETRGNRVSSVQLRGLDEEWGVFDSNFAAQFLLAGGSYSKRQRSGDAVDPRAGLSQFYSAEFGSSSLGSDQDIVRLYGSLTGVRRFSDDWRVVARSELGYLWSDTERPDEIPPSLAFFAGGDNSIRGFAYQSVGREVAARTLDSASSRPLVVGGTRLITGSLEVQRYFGKEWRGALFMDAGDAFVDADFKLNAALGFGVHYLSPVGALRLELARPVTRDEGSWRLHINIGAEF
ncbi:MAG: autotransporter assembly complex family protein [Congregibacter sp.]